MTSQVVDTFGVVGHGHGRQYAPDKQREAIERDVDCAGWVEIGTKGSETLYSAWRMSTRGRTFAVLWLFLVCNARGSAKRKREIIAEFVDEVRERGGEVLEVGSGRRTDDSKIRRKMLSDAQEAVTLGRMPSMTAQKGRKRRVWKPEHKEIIWTEWFSSLNELNEDAAKAASKRLKFKVDQFQMWHVVQDMRIAKGEQNATGASGRPWKTKRK